MFNLLLYNTPYQFVLVDMECCIATRIVQLCDEREGRVC
jgi:hypothetical protein